MNADPKLIVQHHKSRTLKCGHLRTGNEWTRPHVGDVICYDCGRQDYVYDWVFYNSLDHVPEPRKRGSLQAAPQVVA